MEWTLAIATVLELLVVGVLVSSLWQDHRRSREHKLWQQEIRGLARGEDLNAATRY